MERDFFIRDVRESLLDLSERDGTGRSGAGGPRGGRDDAGGQRGGRNDGDAGDTSRQVRDLGGIDSQLGALDTSGARRLASAFRDLSAGALPFSLACSLSPSFSLERALSPPLTLMRSRCKSPHHSPIASTHLAFSHSRARSRSSLVPSSFEPPAPPSSAEVHVATEYDTLLLGSDPSGPIQHPAWQGSMQVRPSLDREKRGREGGKEGVREGGREFQGGRKGGRKREVGEQRLRCDRPGSRVVMLHQKRIRTNKTNLRHMLSIGWRFFWFSGRVNTQRKRPTAQRSRVERLFQPPGC